MKFAPQILPYFGDFSKSLNSFYKSAINYLKKVHSFNDSIRNKELIERTADLEARYESARKETRIQQMKIQNQLVESKSRLYQTIVISLVLLLGVAGFALWWLNNTKKQVERATQQRDQLFSFVAHDLRSPALSLQSLTQMINYELERGNIVHIRAWADVVQKSATSLYALVDNLLQWTLAQHGRLVNHPEMLIAEHEIELVVESLESTAHLKRICINVDLSHETPVYADRSGFQTIIRNLATNAIKFTQAEGLVQLKINQLGNWTSIQVIDNGPGIAPEVLPGLFQKKQNQSPENKGVNKGTGLGLYLCKYLCELDRGKIHVVSQQGKGTVFTIELPSGKETGRTLSKRKTQAIIHKK